ncbi:amphi-Trp domain-containing protein [Halobacteriales archaeon QS_1_68_17]|nr:MAG: amphi-Trp domain-containing protein [Halobacteriales archaeon QS_1_68_17]
MSEEVLFESEHRKSRQAVADYLRTVADRLAAGEEISLQDGADSISVTPPQHVEFEVKAEREGPADGPGELSVEFEIEWHENGSGGSLEIS